MSKTTPRFERKPWLDIVLIIAFGNRRNFPRGEFHALFFVRIALVSPGVLVHVATVMVKESMLKPGDSVQKNKVAGPSGRPPVPPASLRGGKNNYKAIRQSGPAMAKMHKSKFLTKFPPPLCENGNKDEM